MYLQKVTSKKTLRKKKYFCCHLVSRIRIRTKMSRIHYTFCPLCLRIQFGSGSAPLEKTLWLISKIMFVTSSTCDAGGRMLASLQLSKENIQHFKTEISKLFLLLWVISCPPGSSSGSTDPIKSGSETLMKTYTILWENNRTWYKERRQKEL